MLELTATKYDNILFQNLDHGSIGAPNVRPRFHPLMLVVTATPKVGSTLYKMLTVI